MSNYVGTAIRHLMAGVSLCALISGTSHAGNLRDDVVAAAGGIGNVIEADPKFTPVVNITAGPANANFCTGSLINSRTILTAAHCFGSLPPAITLGITFDPTTNPPAPNAFTHSYLVHPDYASRTTFFSQNDVALLTLSAPVENVDPVTLSPATVPAGTQVISVGYGTNGSGSVPNTNSDGQLRSISNIIDIHDILVISGIPQINGAAYIADFDDPLLGAPNFTGGGAIANEGSPSNGDSGGPLFVVNGDGSLLQIGTVVGGTQLHGPIPLGGYGSLMIWAPTGTNYSWIQLNNPLRNMQATTDGAWEDAGHWQGEIPQFSGVVPHNSPPGASATFKTFYTANISAGATTLSSLRTVDSVRVSGSGNLTINPGAVLGSEGTSMLQGGETVVNGNILARTLAMTGGRLSGTGTVGTITGTSVSGGIVAPGNSIGTLRIAGNYTQSGNGALQIELDGTTSDQFLVSGAMTLGGNLEIVLLPGGTAPPNGHTFTVANAATITGNFAAIDDRLPGVLRVASDGVTGGNSYQVIIGRELYANYLAGTARADRGAALDALRGTSGTETMFDTLDVLEQSDLITALNRLTPGKPVQPAPLVGGSGRLVAGQIGSYQIGGAPLSPTQTVNFNELGRSLHSLDERPTPAMDRMTAAFDRAARPRTNETSTDTALGFGSLSGDREGAWGVMAASDTVFGTVDTTAGEDSYWVQATTIGLDRKVGRSALGAAVSYLRAKTSLATGGEIESEGIALSAFGSHRWETGLWITAFAACSIEDIEIDRHATIGATTVSAAADTESTGLLFGATLGYDIFIDAFRTDEGHTIEGLVLTPLASLDFAETETEGYRETGPAAIATTLSNNRTSSLRSALGLQLAKSFRTEDGTIRPYLRAVWTHEFDADPSRVTAAFNAAPTNTFAATGTTPTEDWIRVGIGAEIAQNDGWTFGLAAETDLARDDVNRHRIAVSAKLNF